MLLARVVALQFVYSSHHYGLVCMLEDAASCQGRQIHLIKYCSLTTYFGQFCFFSLSEQIEGKERA